MTGRQLGISIICNHKFKASLTHSVKYYFINLALIFSRSSHSNSNNKKTSYRKYEVYPGLVGVLNFLSNYMCAYQELSARLVFRTNLHRLS